MARVAAVVTLPKPCVGGSIPLGGTALTRHYASDKVRTRLQDEVDERRDPNNQGEAKSASRPLPRRAGRRANHPNPLRGRHSAAHPTSHGTASAQQGGQRHAGPFLRPAAPLPGALRRHAVHMKHRISGRTNATSNASGSPASRCRRPQSGQHTGFGLPHSIGLFGGAGSIAIRSTTPSHRRRFDRILRPPPAEATQLLRRIMERPDWARSCGPR